MLNNAWVTLKLYACTVEPSPCHGNGCTSVFQYQQWSLGRQSSPGLVRPFFQRLVRHIIIRYNILSSLCLLDLFQRGRIHQHQKKKQRHWQISRSMEAKQQQQDRPNIKILIYLFMKLFWRMTYIFDAPEQRWLSGPVHALEVSRRIALYIWV